MVAKCPFPKASPHLFPSVVRFTLDMEFLTIQREVLPCGICPFNLRPTVFAKNTYLKCQFGGSLLLAFLMHLGVGFCCFSEQELANIRLEGRKLQLTRILKPELTLTVCQAAERMW